MHRWAGAARAPCRLFILCGSRLGRQDAGIYPDLFDGDLDAVSEALDQAVSLVRVGKMGGTPYFSTKQKALLPLQTKGSRAFLIGGDGGI